MPTGHFEGRGGRLKKRGWGQGPAAVSAFCPWYQVRWAGLSSLGCPPSLGVGPSLRLRLPNPQVVHTLGLTHLCRTYWTWPKVIVALETWGAGLPEGCLDHLLGVLVHQGTGQWGGAAGRWGQAPPPASAMAQALWDEGLDWASLWCR